MATYHDSTGKRIARTILWMRILSRTASLRKKDLRYAYLASGEGADAAVLTALGVPQYQQLAIDHDPKAMSSFRLLYPGIPTYMGNVRDLLSPYSARHTLAAAYLDLCATGTDEAALLVAECAEAIAEGGTLAYTIVRGREKNTKGVKTGIKASMYDGRAELFSTNVQSLVNPYLRPHTRIHYHSRTNDSAGLPMLIEALTVKQSEYRGTMEIAPTTLSLKNLKALVEKPQLSINLSNAKTEGLVLLSHALEAEGLDVCKVLHTSKSTMAAWRAHYTRGTYA